MTLIGAIMLTYGIGAFDLVFVMTNGGPGTSTELLGTYAYKLAFRRNEVGYGATVALLITVLSFIATAAFVRYRERGRSRDRFMRSRRDSLVIYVTLVLFAASRCSRCCWWSRPP